jgi:hypothetical protein
MLSVQQGHERSDKLTPEDEESCPRPGPISSVEHRSKAKGRLLHFSTAEFESSGSACNFKSKLVSAAKQLLVAFQLSF